MTENDDNLQVPVVVPAAGIGKRMASDIPKQYLRLNGKTILEHTVERLLSHNNISQVILALHPDDKYFQSLPLAQNPNVKTVIGGDERCDSVLAGLKAVNENPDTNNAKAVMVHDAARPCVSLEDISNLIKHYQQTGRGGILASPVRDTMKRSNAQQQILHTEARDNLWHALTPQLFNTVELISAIERSLKEGAVITDEASAMEYCGYAADVIPARSDNIKITQPEDLHLAEFILQQQYQTNRNSSKSFNEKA
ncbi:2-C-methyl-D-erythritol 4-phosphate cytidylyltransferase [Thalassotalea mangrovi]|uniref:2-C-methyl-D-erythritol 4-phosphate cytidylyltransferase n=1 Tax=Thalassotalea mangrovi TaxID=2572245 RepID=A0A4U1B6T1_9GAMM|nr:2-C-methyl-D-erythritol 4-phosphate cytidylyltransferase [Thalassotalea mangrovi]TKB46160.1 2-C-methyl-D-erythritol 4-phosphate cytidylyltransferase [Thalassotalea mangrovi]